MNSLVVRKKFLDFFKKREHIIVPSSSLIPRDSSVLFTTAGMQQFKPYFLEEKSPYGSRVASCQKCLRTSDVDSVGDNTHLTFFEMLGNFSFAASAKASGEGGTGYFKKESIEWGLDFLTKDCGIKIEKLRVTYFKGDPSTSSGQVVPEDKESREILQKLGFPKENIFGFGREDNFWGPTGDEGPCGPTTEIHYDMTGHPCQKQEKCLPNCECGRFVEIWNHVFNEFYQDKNKKLAPLPKKGVDTGMGLERLLLVLENKPSVFETDVFLPVIKKLEELSQKSYSPNQRFFRIIADHIKGSVFLIAEGILPSNLERGYILRRLLRRAIRYGKLLSLSGEFLIPVAQKVIDIYKDIYPEVLSKQAEILTVIENEEEKFSKTLERGIEEFKVQSSKFKVQKTIPGSVAFNLYQSYGFPLEMTKELARDSGLIVDEEGFKEVQKKHQEISRAGIEKKFGGHGIEKTETKENKIKITKLHTATHLLHQALREVLGEHVKQMGSDITQERLRFDFAHSQKMSQEEIKKVEELVNQKIKEDLAVRKEEMDYEEALRLGALAFAFFSARGGSALGGKERYPETVSVYSIGPSASSGQAWSKEICAGPHMEKTGELGTFKIKKEEACQAGVRRIRAVLE